MSNEEKQLLLDRTFLHIWEIIRFIINSKNYVKETLESIKKGVLYSKDDGDGDTYSMIPPTEDVVSSYSVDVTKDNGKTVHIGDYSTVEELDKAISDAVKNGQLTQEEADSVQQ